MGRGSAAAAVGGQGEVVAGVGHWDSMIASVDDEKAGFYGVFVQSRANKASKQQEARGGFGGRQGGGAGRERTRCIAKLAAQRHGDVKNEQLKW